MRLLKRQILATIFCVSAILLPTTAFSAVNMILKFGSVAGDSEVPGYEGRIDLLAFAWGTSRAVDLFPAPPQVSKAFAQDVSITKYVDIASSPMTAAFLAGTPTTAVLTVVSATGGEIIRMELCDVYLTSISGGGSGGEDRLTENLTLAFKSFRLTNFDGNSKGGGAGDSVQWDFGTSTAGNCDVGP